MEADTFQRKDFEEIREEGAREGFMTERRS